MTGMRSVSPPQYGKRRVAIIIPRLALLGPVIVMQNLVNEIYNDRNLSLKLFYIDRKIDPGMDIGIQVERLNWTKFSYEDFDIIHTSGLRPDLFAFLYRKKIKYYISTIHNYVFDDLKYEYGPVISKIFGNIWIWLWKRADRLVCVSDALRQYYSRWFMQAKMTVIHNGIRHPDISSVSDFSIGNIVEKFHKKGLKVIGFVGMLNRRKGLDQLLHLISYEQRFALIIIGDGKRRTELEKLSKNLRVTDRLYFCGFKRNVTDYFPFFDMFIMPSRSEGFGLALIEAVQHKVPVICSDLAVFTELFNCNEITFYERESIISLRSALITLCKEGEFKIEPAYQKFEKNYKSSIMSQKYLELYNSL